MSTISVYEIHSFGARGPDFAGISYSAESGFSVQALETGAEFLPAAERLQKAVEELARRGTLSYRRNVQIDGEFRLYYDKVSPDDPLYLLAAAQILSSEFGFGADWDEED